jgi:hypothetical protein
VYNAVDITEYNLTRIIKSLETFEDYHLPPEQDRWARMKQEWSGEKVEEIKEEEVAPDAQPCIMPGLANVKFIFLMDPLDAILKRNKF